MKRLAKRFTRRLRVPVPNRNFEEQFTSQTVAEVRLRNMYTNFRFAPSIERSVRSFCMFLGYPRSGHSIVGALLDAHPQILISHEANVLQYVRHGFSQREIFSVILRNSQSFARHGRGWSDKSYIVNAQWQGSYRDIAVVGDKQGGGTTWALRQDPHLFDLLERTIDKRITFIHHVRNPYDMISTHCNRSGLAAVAPEHVQTMGEFLETVSEYRRHLLQNGSLFEGRHEQFIENPRSYLHRLCEVLGVECSDSYLQSCADIVNSSPRKSRYSVKWSQPLLADVQLLIDKYDFLTGYTYCE